MSRIKAEAVEVLNRLTGVVERMNPIGEASYHVARCTFDMDDPSANAQRKRRAKVELAYWRSALRDAVQANTRRR
jgi:hypothetical protein